LKILIESQERERAWLFWGYVKELCCLDRKYIKNLFQKENGLTQPKRIKAEAFDVMQYFYRTAHEPLIHCLISFRGHVDEAALIKAVSLSLKAIPILSCTFETTGRRPYWRVQNFSGEDMVHVVKTGSNPIEQRRILLAETIDITREPQLKIYVIREPNCDTLCIIINHMVCDGAGFKEYLYLLSDIYTQCVNMSVTIHRLQAFPRDARQLFTVFRWTDKLKILFSHYDLAAQKVQSILVSGYPLQGDVDYPFFVTNRISKEDFLSIRRYAKQHDATFNDFILTAYIRVLFKKTGINPIIIPCPIDLRKYLPADWKYGIANFITNLTCNINLDENELFEQTLTKVSAQLKRQKSSNNCLKSVMMLELIYHVLPFRAFRNVFTKVFAIPVISFTNLGIIDKNRLHFGSEIIEDVYLTGAVKYVPYFQIAVSTYADRSTLSCNLHGTPQDRMTVEKFLDEVKEELFAFRGSDI
jgi:NRPS condensation-like uncharacterized protein